ncbi:MAG: hypothetical protein GY702_14670, partial [Desulfobulbaceae bacterium]|nr:hypothetical protein [Desulfobulbaceae bacterium]
QGNLRTCFACGQQGHFMRNLPVYSVFYMSWGVLIHNCYSGSGMLSLYRGGPT